MQKRGNGGLEAVGAAGAEVVRADLGGRPGACPLDLRREETRRDYGGGKSRRGLGRGNLGGEPRVAPTTQYLGGILFQSRTLWQSK